MNTEIIKIKHVEIAAGYVIVFRPPLETSIVYASQTHRYRTGHNGYISGRNIGELKTNARKEIACTWKECVLANENTLNDRQRSLRLALLEAAKPVKSKKKQK